MKLVVVEDEFVIAEDIKSLLVEQDYDVLGVFDSAEEALPFIVEKLPDLILVDIRLAGQMTGIQLVEQVKFKISLPVIFITANSDTETYLRAKATRPNAFLVKPFTPANLLTSIDLALFNFSEEQTPEKIEIATVVETHYEAIIHRSLFVKNKGKHVKISSDDILFIEAAGSYIHIQTTTERFTLTQNLSRFLKKTPLDNVLRIHRSYLINIDKIDSFEESYIYIAKHKIPLSDTYKDEFLSRIHRL
ncbi:MAG: response regulator [Cyclobacteriaceae bacterium]